MNTQEPYCTFTSTHLHEPLQRGDHAEPNEVLVRGQLTHCWEQPLVHPGGVAGGGQPGEETVKR